MIKKERLKTDLKDQLYCLPKKVRKDILYYLCYMRFIKAKYTLINFKNGYLKISIKQNKTYILFRNKKTRFFYSRNINLVDLIKLIDSMV